MTPTLDPRAIELARARAKRLHDEAVADALGALLAPLTRLLARLLARPPAQRPRGASPAEGRRPPRANLRAGAATC